MSAIENMHMEKACVERNSTVATVSILYASQSGNTEWLAETLLLQFLSSHIPVRMVSLVDYSVQELSEEQYVLLLVSTTGDGEMPDDGVELYEHLLERQQHLPELNYSVLALGDKQYSRFCQAGRDIDVLLAAAGAQRLCQRVDCDADFNDSAQQWSMQVLRCCQSLAAKHLGNMLCE